MPVKPIEPIRVWRKGSVNLVRQSLHVFLMALPPLNALIRRRPGRRMYIGLISKVGWFIHVLQHYT